MPTETWVSTKPAVPVEAVADPGFYDAVADDAWSPVQVPLPTYVLAPKAPRSVRVIDLNAPGAWTSGRGPAAGDGDPLDETAAELAAAAMGAERPEIIPDGIVTGQVLVERRAVGD